MTSRALGVTVDADLVPLLYAVKHFLRHLDIGQPVFRLHPEEVAGFRLGVPFWGELMFPSDHALGADRTTADGTAGTPSCDECQRQHQHSRSPAADPEVSAGPFHTLPLGPQGSEDCGRRQQISGVIPTREGADSFWKTPLKETIIPLRRSLYVDDEPS